MCLGIPGQIIELLDADKLLAKVDISGVKCRVNIACIVNEQHPVSSVVGQWVLVHVGFAMSLINEEEAKNTLKLLHELGEADKELGAISRVAEADQSEHL